MPSKVSESLITFSTLQYIYKLQKSAKIFIVSNYNSQLFHLNSILVIYKYYFFRICLMKNYLLYNDCHFMYSDTKSVWKSFILSRYITFIAVWKDFVTVTKVHKNGVIFRNQGRVVGKTKGFNNGPANSRQRMTVKIRLIYISVCVAKM